MPMIFSLSIFLVSILSIISIVLLYRFNSTNKAIEVSSPEDEQVTKTEEIFSGIDELRRLKIQIRKANNRVNPAQLKKLRGRAVIVARAAKPYKKPNKKIKPTPKDARLI